MCIRPLLLPSYASTHCRKNCLNIEKARKNCSKLKVANFGFIFVLCHFNSRSMNKGFEWLALIPALLAPAMTSGSKTISYYNSVVESDGFRVICLCGKSLADCPTLHCPSVIFWVVHWLSPNLSELNNGRLKQPPLKKNRFTQVWWYINIRCCFCLEREANEHHT